MAKEKKVRGRRDKEKKEKIESSLADNNDFVSLENDGVKSDNENIRDVSEVKQGNIVTPFFGLVNSVELEYFKQAESTLNINAFETPEERLGFVASVFEEAKGKELKLVTNQICSKLVERLILSANAKQMKQLFKAFNGHAVALSNQKYSSHCMETFLIRCASLVEKELLREQDPNYEDYEEEEQDEDEATVTMENLFLYVVGELLPHLNEIVINQYASHVLRVVLYILAGKQLPSSVESNSILRSKKSKIARKMIHIKDNEDYERSYQTPSSFKEELAEVLKSFGKGQTTESLRELAIHKVASPVIQLFIQLEGLVDKDRTFWNKVFNKFEEGKDSKEEAFVEYLLSDPIGSHFFETCLMTQRVKNITRLYNLYMKDRILKLARRETTGVFVVQAVLKKVRPADQLQILDSLVPSLNELMVNNLEIGQAIVDCSTERDDYKRDEIVQKFKEFFNKSVTSESPASNSQSQILENVLKLSTSTLGNTKDDWPTAVERRRAIFLEKIIAYDQSILDACLEGLLELPEERLFQMCCHGVFSHVVESVLDPDRVSIVNRRRLLNALMSEIVPLSCNAQGSHIVDKLWPFTIKLNIYKDRIAKMLFDEKDKVKNSVYGKQVWKNWSMEMYSRRIGDWKRLIKTQEHEKYPPKELPAASTATATESSGSDAYKRREEFSKESSGSTYSNKKQKVRGRFRN